MEILRSNMARSILIFLVSGIVFDTAAGTSPLKSAFLQQDAPTCVRIYKLLLIVSSVKFSKAPVLSMYICRMTQNIHSE